MASTKQNGDDGENMALRHLLQQGLQLVQRNYRVAVGPRARGGEIDLIMRDREGTLVFVEVRRRKNTRFGGAASSISVSKQKSLQYAAMHYLLQFRQTPACRFDVLAIEGDAIQWIQGAFEAST